MDKYPENVSPAALAQLNYDALIAEGRRQQKETYSRITPMLQEGVDIMEKVFQDDEALQNNIRNFIEKSARSIAAGDVSSLQMPISMASLIPQSSLLQSIKPMPPPLSPSVSPLLSPSPSALPTEQSPSPSSTPPSMSVTQSAQSPPSPVLTSLTPSLPSVKQHSVGVGTSWSDVPSLGDQEVAGSALGKPVYGEQTSSYNTSAIDGMCQTDQGERSHFSQLNQVERANQMTQIERSNQSQISQVSQINEIGSVNHFGQMNQIGQFTHMNQAGQYSQVNQADQFHQMNQMSAYGNIPQIDHVNIIQTNEIGQQNQIEQINPNQHQSNQLNQMSYSGQTTQVNQNSQIGQVGQVISQMNSVGQINQPTTNEVIILQATNGNALSALSGTWGLTSDLSGSWGTILNTTPVNWVTNENNGAVNWIEIPGNSGINWGTTLNSSDIPVIAGLGSSNVSETSTVNGSDIGLSTATSSIPSSTGLTVLDISGPSTVNASSVVTNEQSTFTSLNVPHNDIIHLKEYVANSAAKVKDSPLVASRNIGGGTGSRRSATRSRTSKSVDLRRRTLEANAMAAAVRQVTMKDVSPSSVMRGIPTSAMKSIATTALKTIQNAMKENTAKKGRSPKGSASVSDDNAGDGATSSLLVEDNPSKKRHIDATVNICGVEQSENSVKEKTQKLLELLSRLENYDPMLPDALTVNYLDNAGVNLADDRIVRLVSLLCQKFITDVAVDALQHTKMRTNPTNANANANANANTHQMAKGSSGSGHGNKHTKDKSTHLAVEDLNVVLNDYGIHVKKPPYFV